MLELSPTNNVITLASGKLFDFSNLESCEMPIEDIAHALSNICRFGGHCREFYSVAEHSVLVSQCVPKDQMLAALLHDASEAFMGDIPSPLKRRLPDYKELEKIVEQIVAKKFGIPFPMSEEIKRADMEVRAKEIQVLMPQNVAWKTEEGVKPADVKVCGLVPASAKLWFVNRYLRIKEGRDL